MKELLRSILIFVAMSLLTGLAYPFIITGISNIAMPQKAQGSLIISKDKVIGSALIGQMFSDPTYFHGRPSALEKAYDASNSGGSNFGPSNKKFLDEVAKKAQKVRNENGLGPAVPVPADLVLASASGLDPHTGVDAAMVQVKRVAKARGFDEPQVQEMVQRRIEEAFLGFIGQKRINVLQLNIDLDRTPPQRKGETK
jgi:K+-transporting ATPase ATPase C chain